MTYFRRQSFSYSAKRIFRVPAEARLLRQIPVECRRQRVWNECGSGRAKDAPPDNRPASSPVKAKFHYTGPTGPDRTRTDFVGDPHGLCGLFCGPGLPRNSVGSVRVSDKVRAGPVGSGGARVVEFSLYPSSRFSVWTAMRLCLGCYFSVSRPAVSVSVK